MAERSEDAGDSKPDLAGGEDHIGALPDVLLQQVLSLLPSREAVRTCVLAARWRTLWKSVPSIRINSAGEIYRNPLALSMFANYLLLLRDRTALHECDINSYYGGDSEEAFRYIELWLRYAVSCQVRVLRVHVKNELKDLCLSNVSLVTQHLTRLELCSIEAGGRFLDFSGCPALKVLKMEHCTINAGRISSQSLSHLIICYGGLEKPVVIVVITIISLGTVAVSFVVVAPIVSTITAMMIACFFKFIGRMDFKWHVMFSQLKTLLLSEWCMAADFSGLIYFVQHSPVLERLTLHLKYYEEESAIETEESYNPRPRFLVSKHLKVVEIKCRKEDEKIHQIVKILGTHGVPPERINIEPNFHDYGLGCFSFE